MPKHPIPWDEIERIAQRRKPLDMPKPLLSWDEIERWAKIRKRPAIA